MTRVAAIDCGTNSVRLLIADASAAGLVEVERDLHLTRLGQGVDATGRFAPDALARTLDAIADFAGRIAAAKAERVRLVATSAARDASNRDEFFAGVRERLGVDAEIISGADEAKLSFLGALSATEHVEWPVLVMDIGGGSTELVLGRPDADGVPVVVAANSLDVGSVRMRERFLHTDPPTPDEVNRASAYIDDLIDNSGVDIGQARTWIGVGGTATSLAAIGLGLRTYDRARVNAAVLATDAVAALAQRLLQLPVAEVTAIPTMQPKRADVICGGALIASRVAARARTPMRVSESDILDGVALALADGQRAGGS